MGYWDGDKANIGLVGGIVYSIVPVLGQLLMRLFTLNGSLDKIWFKF